MLQKIKKFFLITVLSILLYSCQGAQDVIQGKKRSDTNEEFLVEKKNPLMMPPDYDELPAPGNQEVSPETFSGNNEVKDLLNIQEANTPGANKDDGSSDLESSIIEKIQ